MLTVTIDGTDRTENIDYRTFRKGDNINSMDDTLEFIFIGEWSERPQESQEIIVLDDGTKKFGGYILRVEEQEPVYNRLAWYVTAVDYQRFTEKRLVVKEYLNKTLKQIVTDINSGYLSGFTVNNVETGPTFEKIKFNYMYPRECFEELAELAQMHWYIDYDKDIHFFERESNNAPISIEEGNGKYDDLQITTDVTELRNSITVRGGTYESDLFADNIPTDGENRVLPTRYKIRELDSATLNGSDLSEFGTEYADDKADKEILVNYVEQHILVGDLIVSVPTSSDELILNYRYDVPVLIQKEDDVSIARMASLEGGDGVYEHVIVDKSINSKELARQRADAELKKYANPIVRLSFLTNESGLRSGQLIYVNLSSRGIDDYFLIKSVVMTSDTPDGSVITYKVETESTLKGIDDLLIQLFSVNKRISDIRDDEILDKLKGFEDTVKLTDSVSHTTSTPESRVDHATAGYSEVG